MEPSPYGEANNHSTNQEISSLLWNVKVYYYSQGSCHWTLSWARWI